MSYRIVELTPTLQGEGAYSGAACVLVRFSGCNLWTGRQEDREKDAERNGVECPRWCDTDFRSGVRSLGIQQLRRELEEAGAGPDRFVLLTGGEPLLHVDLNLLNAIHALGARAHVETNGTVELRDRAGHVDWVTVSPKTDPARCVVERIDELKLVVPAYDPGQWEVVPALHRFVMPLDRPGTDDGEIAAVRYACDHPKWRLCLQLHKVIGVR